MNTDHFICNYRSSIEMKLSSSSFYNSINMVYKLDTGKNYNTILVYIYKKLFPKVTNKGVRQSKTCKIKIRNNEKEKNCKVFVAHNSRSVMLGMQDIDKLSLISVNCNTTHRKVAKGDKVDNSDSTSQTESCKCKQFTGEKQETEVQSTQDAENTSKLPIVTNPMVMGNNNNHKELIAELIADTRNNDSIDFLSELLCIHSLISDAERKNDMMTENT